MNIESQLKLRGPAALAPITVAMLGLMLTGWGTASALQHLRDADEQRFLSLTQRLTGEINRRVGVYRSGLMGFRSLYVASNSVQRAEFRAATRSLDFQSEFPGALGAGYIRSVPRPDVASFLAETRADGAPAFELRSTGKREQLMVVEFIEPLERNRDAEGLDVAQEVRRRDAAVRAATTGEASLTAKLDLVQARTSGPGFLYLLALYRNGELTDTPAHRKIALQGWVFMPIVAAKVFRGAANLAEGELDFEVFEGGTPTPDGLIYDDDGHLRFATEPVTLEQFQNRDFARFSAMEIGGCNWTVSMSTTPRFRAQSRSGVWEIAFGGTALSLLLGLLLRAQASAVRRATALADSMTSELRRLAMVAQRSTNGVLITDAHGIINWVNQGFTRIVGFTAEDLTGREISQTFDFQKTERATCAQLKAALHAGEAFRGELVRRSKDGETRWLDADIQPLRDERGSLTGFIAVETDVTDTTRASAALQESQTKLQLLLDSTGEAIYGIDLKGFFTFCNPACVRQLGYTSQTELLGKHAHALIHHTRSDGRVHPLHQCPIDQVSRTGLECHVHEDVFWRADNSRLWVEYSSHPQRTADRLVGAVVTFVDITERNRLAAEAARAVSQLAISNAALEEAQLVGRLGNWSIDLETWRAEWSKQLYWLFERDVFAGPLDFAGWQALCADEDAVRHATLIAHAVEQGASYSIVLKRRSSGNGVRHIRVEGRARSSAGRVVGLYGTAADVTAEVEREATLEIAQHRAEDASRSKSEFLANMSHEIRTPMTAILGYTDLLAEEGPGSASGQQRLEYCDTIKRNGEHLLAIINDILDISKIEAGMLQIERVATLLEPLVLEVMTTMRVRATAKGIALSYEPLSQLPTTIHVDPIRLRQILINLVGNAVKFTEVGSVRLAVAHETDPETRLRFDIHDTGIGLTPEQSARIFGAFQQADSSTTRRFGGSGLGLQISKRLAQMLGGDISLRSELGRGSVFSVSIDPGALNLAQGSTRDSASSKESKPAALIDQALCGARILLAEDGEDNQRLIASYLRKAGAEVRIVANGRSAVEALTADGTLAGSLAPLLLVDMIVTDMQMPEMDGYQATRILRAKGCTLPIVALTAHAMSGDAEKCLAAGCDGYSAKPIDRKQLVDICRKAIAGELRKPAAALPLSPAIA
jgi:PAS domain S-box-containing protein